MRNGNSLVNLSVAAFGLLGVTPICGRWFVCGCDWPWRGLFLHCTSLRGGAGLLCPWCEHPLLGVAVVLLSVLGGLGAAAVSREAIGRAQCMPPGCRIWISALLACVAMLGFLQVGGALTSALL